MTDNYPPQFFIDSTTQTAYVEGESALANLIKILRDNTTACDPPKASITLAKLTSSIKVHLKDNWTNLYKDTYGSMNEFIKAHPAIFELSGSDGTIVSLKVTDQPVKVLPSAEFQDALVANMLSTLGSQVEGGSTLVTTDEELALQIMHDDAAAAAAAAAASATSTTSTAPTTNTTTAEVAGEWQKPPSKRGRKAKTTTPTSPTTPTPPPPSTSNNTSSNIQSEIEKTRMKSKNILVYKLANDILNYYHGQYFEFNDSNVVPMPIVNLQK